MRKNTTKIQLDEPIIFTGKLQELQELQEYWLAITYVAEMTQNTCPIKVYPRMNDNSEMTELAYTA